MQITRQTEYAIHTILELARLPYGELVPTKTIARRQDIPEDFLKKTVRLLARAGLVQTQRGTHGGVRLARPGGEITITDVITAIEGPLAINVCLEYGNQCPNKATCRVHRVLRRVQRVMLDELNRYSFADIVAMERQ